MTAILFCSGVLWVRYSERAQWGQLCSGMPGPPLGQLKQLGPLRLVELLLQWLLLLDGWSLGWDDAEAGTVNQQASMWPLMQRGLPRSVEVPGCLNSLLIR